MADIKEKRGYQRYNIEFDVRVSKPVGGGEKMGIESTIGRAKNLSGNGIFLNMENLTDVGDLLQMYFLKPNTFEFFKGTGRVVRKTDIDDATCGVGVQFLDIPESESLEIDYRLR
ncbi:MAG: PilZ domain-containing protein [Myxococcota bacterium]|nr:PilZ domain-containing protein [Myxococcota bacterium]